MGLRAVRHFKASLALLLLAGVAGAEGAPRVLLGPEPVPELAVVRAIGSCRGAGVPCFEGAWLDGFRLARDASAIGLDARPGFLRVRRELLLDELYADLGRTLSPLSEGELRAAYEKDISEFVRPEAIRIFRILLESEEAGRAAVAALPEVVTLKDWRARARELSVDRATHERGGDLGFVGPDGGTDLPEVRADPALYAAATRLKDGEVLRQLVPEGSKFALIWRRGTRAKLEQTFEDVRADLSLRVDEARRYELLRTLMDDLRKTQLREFNPNKLALYQDAQKSLRR